MPSITEILDTIATLDDKSIGAILSACAARMATRVTPPAEPVAEPDDTNLTVEEAATRIRRSTKWIYRHRSRLPFVRKIGSRSYIVSRNGLDRWLSRQRS